MGYDILCVFLYVFITEYSLSLFLIKLYRLPCRNKKPLPNPCNPDSVLIPLL